MWSKAWLGAALASGALLLGAPAALAAASSQAKIAVVDTKGAQVLLAVPHDGARTKEALRATLIESCGVAGPVELREGGRSFPAGYFIPEIDDEVIVAFMQGDIRRPIVVGSLWSGKDAAPERSCTVLASRPGKG